MSKINQPCHYTNNGKVSIETWDLITKYNLGFVEGNIVKYLSRSSRKNGIEDILKAEVYYNKYLEVREKNIINRKEMIKIDDIHSFVEQYGKEHELSFMATWMIEHVIYMQFENYENIINYDEKVKYVFKTIQKEIETAQMLAK